MVEPVAGEAGGVLSPADVLGALRVRLVGAFPAMLRTVLDAVDDETLWWQPAPGVNPIGVLVLHCAGNLRHYVGLHVGGIPYVRDRPAEFDAARRLPMSEVRAELDRAVAAVEATLDGLDARMLGGPSRDPDGRHTMLYEDLLSATAHLALHTGQAVQLAKLRGVRLPERVWGEAHRGAGASRV